MERDTKQQKQIYEVLKDCKSHPTLQQLTHLVREKYPRIGQATVYRFIQRYTKRGLISKIPTLDNSYRYDIQLDHQHFECILWGKIEDIVFHETIKKEIQKTIGKNRILFPQVLIQGVCEECKEKYEKEM